MRKSILYLLIISALIMMMGCTQESKKTEDTTENNEPLYIVTTTAMIGDIIKNIAQEKVEVASLMGPGVDPHLYKATQGDVSKLTKADMVFYNGLKLEGKMESIFEKMKKQKPVFALSDKIPADLLMGEEQNPDIVDPHIWFDINLWIKAVESANEKIQKEDPSNADFYQKNASEYISELKRLHQKVNYEIAQIPEEQRVLITSHDAFRYFGKAYGIKVKGLQGISTVSEFGLKDVADMTDYITRKKIKSIFVESSVSDKSLKAVVEGCKAKRHIVKIGGTLFSDAMGEEGTPEGTYIGMVEHNLALITKGLK